MRSKQIVTLVLLVFVVGSVAAMIYSEMKPAPAKTDAEKPAAGSQETSGKEGRQVVAYYFHGNTRCVTCRTIEAYTEEALRLRFSDAIKDGLLAWKVVNVEVPGNEHFITDYQLHTKSVVLSEVHNGHETKWVNLSQIWNLVGNRDAFIAYIQQETHNLLGEHNG